MSEATLDKTFDPAAIEAKWYAHWEENGLFRPERPDAAPFTIVNPPPNVTGSLHIGHALDNTLQDVVIRYERLRGKDALWVVGTDHAGIATQMVVERQLEAAQDKRTNYSREAFVEKVWQWKAESGGTITQQLRRLGCSMDWSREQFTMSPEFTRAVTKVFVDLYNQGLIYRDKRLVNWDPKFRTAISDLEVETHEVPGHFWHFRYPLEPGVTTGTGSHHIVVATTRPETMLADMAVAVSADDPRYKSVIGRFITLPITGRRIPIVADEHADPELGSGAVKITPGHDFNDFDVGKRARIEPRDMLNMFDAEAKVVQTADGLIPGEFLGLDRFSARKLVVERMQELGHLKSVEDRVVPTPFGDRSNAVIEPWLTDQWYVDAATLAGPPMQAVRDGRIEIVPKSWEKTWFNWMENIQPWCVSRQLWWGHRIPAWYGPTFDAEHLAMFRGTYPKDLPQHRFEQPFVAENEDEAKRLAFSFYSNLLGEDRVASIEFGEAPQTHTGFEFDILRDKKVTIKLARDNDVLDTWFSSALWPFATLGWPDASNPPRHGEVAGPQGLTEGAYLSANAVPGGEVGPLRPSGAPPRSGEDLLARHYPNDLLISGFDILFFWDARMAMMGMHFMGDVPWRRLYLHGLVRAADGQKMSKSKGNVVDPLLLIDEFGADALRFFMAAMESQGRDVKMDRSRVEGYRNFATKLWNAARFCQSNGIAGGVEFDVEQLDEPVNRWIVSQTTATRWRMDQAISDLRFDEFANEIYHFTWSSFCDRYLETIKTFLRGSDELQAETRAVCGWVLDQILIMLHPLMPFITEEIWHATAKRCTELIVNEPTPLGSMPVATGGNLEVSWLFEFIDNTRSMRAELGISPSAKLECYFKNFGQTGNISRYRELLERMARVGAFHENVDLDTTEKATIAVATIPYDFDLRGIIDIAAEKARLAKALEASTKEAKSLEARLANPAFVEKAKPEAVDKARSDHAGHAAEAERLAAALARLG